MNQKKRKIRIRLALSVLALLTVFWACRKNYIDPLDSSIGTAQKGLSLKEAQAFHRSASANFGKADRQVMGTNATPLTFGGEPVVRWNKADSYKNGRFEMLEVPIWFPKTRLPAYSFDGNKANGISDQAMLAAAFSKYVIYRDPLKNKITARILTFMPDKAYLKKYGRYAIKNTGRHLEKNFSGYIEMRDMKQKSILVVRIKAGRVVKTVRVQRRPIGTKDSQLERRATMSGSCPEICDPEYDMECFQGAPNPDASSGYDMECMLVQVGCYWYPDPSCVPDPEWPGSGDCDDPANYYLPQCGYEPNPCEDWGECGGEYGEPPVEIKHKLDSFPCAKNLVSQLTNLRTDISDLLKNSFGKNDKTNVVFEPDPTLAGTSVDGKLKGSTGYGNNFTYFIGLNPDVLNNASKEYMLATMYHEAIHAYLAEKKRILGDVEFNNQFAGLDVNGGRLIGVQDPAHWPMGYTNFINGMRDAILTFNPSFPTDRAYALAAGGVMVLNPAQSTANTQERNTNVPGYQGTKCP